MSSNVKADLKALHSLIQSRGWGVVRDVMEREILAAAMAIADNPTMSLDEINFRRGAIWAGKQLLEMPDRLVRKLETDVLLNEATLRTSDMGRTTGED